MPAIFPEILQAEALYKQSLYQDNRYSSIRAAPLPRRRSAEVPGREPRRGIDPLHLSISCRRHELTGKDEFDSLFTFRQRHFVGPPQNHMIHDTKFFRLIGGHKVVTVQGFFDHVVIPAGMPDVDLI